MLHEFNTNSFLIEFIVYFVIIFSVKIMFSIKGMCVMVQMRIICKTTNEATRNKRLRKASGHTVDSNF